MSFENTLGNREIAGNIWLGCFRRQPEVLLFSLAIIVVHRSHCRVKSVTFCNISVITEDIYLKHGSMCSLSKEKSILTRECLFFFFFRINSLFRLRLYLYQAPQSRALAPAYDCLVSTLFLTWSETNSVI